MHNPSFLSHTFYLPIQTIKTNEASKEQNLPIFRLYPYKKKEKRAKIILSPSEIALFQIGTEEPSFSFEDNQKYTDGFELLLMKNMDEILSFFIAQYHKNEYNTANVQKVLLRYNKNFKNLVKN